MAITPITIYPQSTDAPDVFASNGDAFIKQLATQFVPEANDLQVDVNAKSVTATAQAAIATTQAGIATTQANLAADKVGLAEIQANNAASSAQTALLAPGTSATSVTYVEIGEGLKTFVVQTGKLFIPGMTIKAYSAGNWMLGPVLSYNSGTGDLVLNITNVFGSGMFSDWNISLSAPMPEIPGGISVFSFNNFI